jgi:D-psicose/D-tagatose/L-ribulose 3-epimerase
MRLAISNIAWDVTEDEEIARLLRQYRIDAIDIAPGKYFPEPANASRDEINSVKAWWAERDIEITGMQALLFGTTGLNVFGPKEVQDALFRHLSAVCRIGGGLGATRVVFGSPKNRDRNGLSDRQALDMAIPFFKQLGEIAESFGVLICLEPNPPRYGANFMTTSDETAQVVERVAHPAVRMQLDIGALTINGEDVGAVVKRYAHFIGHVHASEPDLLPLGDANTNHAIAGKTLAQYLPNHIVTIEMVATKNEPHQVAIERALNVAIPSYQGNGAGAEI